MYIYIYIYTSYIWEFRVEGGPSDMDYSMLGSILGSPYL